MNDTNERQRRTITRSFIKEARRGRGWGRATVATVVAVAAVIAALGAFAFAQEIYGARSINTQAPSEYTLNPQNDSNFPTPSIAYTTDTANAQFTSGTCLTSTTVAGASGFAELVDLGVDRRDRMYGGRFFDGVYLHYAGDAGQ